MTKKFRTVLVGFEFYPELVATMRASEGLDIITHLTHESTPDTINVNDIYFHNHDFCPTYQMPVDLYGEFL